MLPAFLPHLKLLDLTFLAQLGGSMAPDPWL